MLNKDVVDHCKNSFHYFQVIKSYVQLVSITTKIDTLCNYKVLLINSLIICVPLCKWKSADFQIAITFIQWFLSTGYQIMQSCRFYNKVFNALFGFQSEIQGRQIRKYILSLKYVAFKPWEDFEHVLLHKSAVKCRWSFVRLLIYCAVKLKLIALMTCIVTVIIFHIIFDK